MEDSTEKLLQQLGGIGSPKGDTPTAKPTVGQTPAVSPSAEKLDHWRILLVDLAYLLNASFRDVYYWEGVKTEKDTFKQFIKILNELNQMPNHDGTVQIVFRGSPGTKTPEKADFVIQFGGLTVDAASISAVIKRMGIRMKHLEGRLLKAFEEFAAQGINTVSHKIPDSSDQSLERMRISLRIISCYKQAVENDTVIEYVKDANPCALKPVLNEFNQPDPNLTQLAALNNLSAENMRELVQKVSNLMKRPEAMQSGSIEPNVYLTVFNIKSLRNRLIRPPIEINSSKGAAAEKSPKGATGAGSGQGAVQGNVKAMPTPIMDPAVLKANVARFVKKAFGDSPEKAAQMMKTVFGQDYKELDLAGLEQRLRLITDLFAALESSPEGQGLREDVLQRIQLGMEAVSKDVLDDLIVQDEVVKIWAGEAEKVVGKADQNLLNIIDASKQKSAARKKMRAALRADAEFSEQDYEQLATDFKISIHDAEQIVKLFKGCFDRQGNFQRALFEKNVPEFARHQNRIFEILWEFLREIPRRSDRLPFLNSLQVLVGKIQQPKQAVKALLSDFVLDPADVSYPDRNALMLAIQFLRTYNKEINMDIEITPEEVLSVKAGLDQRVAQYVVWKVDGEQKRLIEKIVTIRKKLLQSFEQESSEARVLPIRFLLALEREAHIFLSLIGGTTATAVIRGALNVYGNPASQIYMLPESQHHTAALLQHLAVLIRGSGRVGCKEDFSLLDDIRKREQGFLNLSEEPRHAAQVRRTFRLVDAAKREINAGET